MSHYSLMSYYTHSVQFYSILLTAAFSLNTHHASSNKKQFHLSFNKQLCVQMTVTAAALADIMRCSSNAHLEKVYHDAKHQPLTVIGDGDDKCAVGRFKERIPVRAVTNCV